MVKGALRAGPDLARRLTPRRPRMKVIYMTGFSLVDIQNQQIGLEPGVQILPKPFRVDGLIKKVRDVLAESAPAQSNPFAPASPFAAARR